MTDRRERLQLVAVDREKLVKEKGIHSIIYYVEI